MFKKYQDCLNELDKLEFAHYENSYKKFNKIILIGNGGSNAIASHIAEDASKFHNKFALSFSDPAMLTCFINDFKMENAYVEFLKRYSDKDFLNIFISSSGESKNIINCVEYCIQKNFNYGVLTGFNDDNTVKQISKNAIFNLHVKSSNYGVVECIHQIFLHGVI